MQRVAIPQPFDNRPAGIGLCIIEDDIHINDFIGVFFGAIENDADFSFSTWRYGCCRIFGGRTVAGRYDTNFERGISDIREFEDMFAGFTFFDFSEIPDPFLELHDWYAFEVLASA